MPVPNETILTLPLGSSTAASEPEHYVRKAEIDGTNGQVGSALIDHYIGSIGNTGTDPTTVKEFSTVGLGYTGQVVEFSIIAGGTLASNGNTKTIDTGIEGSGISFSTTANGGQWRLEVNIIMNTSAAWFSGTFSTGTSIETKTSSTVDNTNQTFDYLPIILTGGATNDILLKAASLKFYILQA